MASYRDCANRAGLSAEVDAYLRGEMDPDDPLFRQHLDQKKIEAMNQAYQRKLEAVAVSDANEFIKNYPLVRDNLGRFRNKAQREAAAVRAYLTQDDLATGRTSVEDQINATTRAYMGRLNGLVDEADNRGWRQTLTGSGAIADPAFNKNLLHEIFGKATGDGDAARLAKLWRDVAEDLRQQVNKAGGLIRKLDDWGLPQKHIVGKIARVSKEEWIDFVAERLDLGRMGLRNVDDARTMLGTVHETIMTNGANKLDPDNLPTTGRGKLANQHREHRALHFKDSEAWIAYSEKFGDGDAVGAMIGHVRDLSRDLGMMRAMGPNPEAVYRNMRQRVLHAGNMSALDGGRHPGSATNHIDNIWKDLNGMGVEHTGWAEFGSATRTFLSLSKLGGVAISAIPDVGNAASVVAFNGMSQMRWFRGWLKQMTPGMAKGGREQALRLGIMSQQLIEDFRGNARFTEPEAMGLARKTTNAFYKLSLLTAWDRNNRTAFKLAMVGELSDLPARLDDISSKGAQGRLKRVLDKHGITANDWSEFMAAKDPAEGNLINPMEMSSRAASKFIGMLEATGNTAVIQPTARTRAIMHQGLAPGSAGGEGLRFVTQWKSFPIAFMQTRFANMANTLLGRHGDSPGFRAAYTMHQLTTMTALGVLAVQAKEITKGRDPIDPENKADWARLMFSGAAQAGVGGLWYEAVYGVLAHGRSPASILTPAGLSLFDDIVVGALFRDWDLAEIDRADQTLVENMGAAAVRSLGWVPGQSLFYLRAAWDQLLVPYVADQISPREKRRIDNRNRRIRRDRGQERWISQDEIRAPEF